MQGYLDSGKEAEGMMGIGDLVTPAETKWKIRVAVFTILGIIGTGIYNLPGLVREWEPLTGPVVPVPPPPNPTIEMKVAALPEKSKAVPFKVEETPSAPVNPASTEKLQVELLIVIHERKPEPPKKSFHVEKPVEKPPFPLIKKACDGLSNSWDFIVRLPAQAAWIHVISKFHK
jgi:hypothetical protein